MEILRKIWDVIWNTTLATAEIAVAMFGLFFILGLALYLLARFSRNTFAKTLGPRAEVFITAWIGTPVHELGHAFFCLIFGHKITKIKLFTPNSGDGSLGTVEHSYNKKNIYQQMGSFFIGSGPIIFGSLVILGLLQFLLPGGKQIITQLHSDSFAIHVAGTGIIEYLKMIFGGLWSLVSGMFNAENLRSWQFWVFIFLTFTI